MHGADSGADYDIVIAGGGLVGGCLALALADVPARVLLVEAVPPERAEQPSFDDRMIALSYGSCRILRSLGLWEQLSASQSIWPIQKIHVSEQRRFGTAVIDSQEQGVPELGFVIKSRELGALIWERLRDQDKVTIASPASVTTTTASDGQRDLLLDTEGKKKAIATRLLVAADGARSRVRTALGLDARERDYEQVAVVANVQVDPRKSGHVAFERFTPEGPLAMLPGPSGKYTVVLARNTASVAATLEMGDREFLQLVQDAFGYRLGRLSKVGKRLSYPLNLLVAEQLTAERAVLIGNAAHGLHPVAAQGFNLGLRDVACLAELLADGYSNGLGDVNGADQNGFDPGHQKLLSAYSDWRSADQFKVVRFTDGLIRAFGPAQPAVATGRGLALASFDLLPGAKRLLAKQTMGLTGRLSRMARGLPL